MYTYLYISIYICIVLARHVIMVSTNIHQCDNMSCCTKSWIRGTRTWTIEKMCCVGYIG